ncbi:MAG TPA: hypothetical protein VGV35_12315, partial [Bryobacteraceae bacterium]|nr:hypothetical protein [Bryobacteraceae bacterium]
LSAFATACILVAFVVAASAFAWKRNLVSIVWVANGAAVLTAVALLIATRDLVPFLCALLCMALIAEVAASRSHWLNWRPVVAVAGDVAICILMYVYSRPENVRIEYKNVEPALLLTLGSALFAIYGASIAFRTIRLHQRIAVFETGQTAIAFLLAAFSAYSFSSRLGTLGAVCFLLAAFCYTAAFVCFDRLSEPRNYHVYATWGVALVLAGGFLCLRPLTLTLGLNVAAIAATFLGVRSARLTLEFHGLLYVAAAAFVSGLLDYAGRALAGSFPAAPGWTVWTVAASAVVCYSIGGRSQGERFQGEQWNHRFLRVLSAALAVSAAVTFLVSALVWLVAAGMTLGESHVAIIRTLITCAVALALAYSGSRWRRIELIWIAYGVLALVTVKLLFEDLYQGHAGSVAVSISLYAVALIAVPRMARMGRRRTNPYLRLRQGTTPACNLDH